ncbi:hypothetical protein L1987_43377 [Smallanthus sonchifolius]|uniref:Uncharacterized protein n=1 Tax=Smallanthus sonchifolius TaxID=185202 RepID=A0ACB9GM55_9ASTR|nr:hypothetical protein L1987_43377 [Smallanthus sonchifolius]
MPFMVKSLFVHSFFRTVLLVYYLLCCKFWVAKVGFYRGWSQWEEFSALVTKAFGYGVKTLFLVGIMLAQIGEFAFVLLSRASNLHLHH